MNLALNPEISAICPLRKTKYSFVPPDLGIVPSESAYHDTCGHDHDAHTASCMSSNWRLQIQSPDNQNWCKIKVTVMHGPPHFRLMMKGSLFSGEIAPLWTALTRRAKTTIFLVAVFMIDIFALSEKGRRCRGKLRDSQRRIKSWRTVDI